MKRVEGNPNVSLIECTNPIKGLWRIRWDIQTNEETSSYMEEEVDCKPTSEEVKNIVLSYYNREIESSILSGMEYEGVMVWLSTENQFNYKSAYDLAVQTEGRSLPVTFKFGTDQEPIYHRFESVEDISDFYMLALAHINVMLEEGWKQKDSINWEGYK